MEIAGLQSLTLLDYPGKVACTVFFAGCNLRCPYCHNAALVLAGASPRHPARRIPANLPPEPPGEARRRVPHRRGADAPEGLAGAHRQNPRHGLSRQARHQRHKAEVLKALLDEKLLDYVAMDIKTPLTAMPRPAGRTFWPRCKRAWRSCAGARYPMNSAPPSPIPITPPGSWPRSAGGFRVYQSISFSPSWTPARWWVGAPHPFRRRSWAPS